MPFAVTGPMVRTPLFVALAILATLSVACDKKSPSEPSTPVGNGAGVSIIGTVSAPVPAGLQVTVGGTTTSAQVDGTGQFALTNAPSGTIDLRFTGPGVSSTLVLSNLLADQTVTMVVTVAGQLATLESCRRVRGTDEEVEGRIESVTAPSTFVVAGRTVSTGASTTITAGGQAVAFDALGVGQRITVKGQGGGAALIAALVDILSPVVIGNLTLNGAISNFTGTRSGFQFTVGPTQIHGDAATIFDAGSQFIEMGNGLMIAVTGAQRTGFVYATRLTITSAPTSFTGRIISMSGTAPQLVVIVTTQTIMVTSLTDVRRKGDPQSASTIANGQTIDVTGRAMADGTVVASIVNILTDAPGGTFSMTGTITATSGSCPQIQLTVASYTINANQATTFSGASCVGLLSGTRVEITGTVQQDFSITASSIKKV
jgi:hypothetical protein